MGDSNEQNEEEFIYERHFTRWEAQREKNLARNEGGRHNVAVHALSTYWYVLGKKLRWAQCQLLGSCILEAHLDLWGILCDEFGEEIDSDHEIVEEIGGLFAVNYEFDNIIRHEMIINSIMKYFKSMDGAEDVKIDRDYVEEFCGEVLMDEVVLRRFISELLMSTDADTSFWRFPLQHSLRLLNAGEVDALATPPASKHQGRPYQLSNWKRIAIEHVCFLNGQGFKKIEAQKRVGGEIGQEVETLRTWEKEARKDFDGESRLRFALLAGKFDREIAADPIGFRTSERDIEGHRGTSGAIMVAAVHSEIAKRNLSTVREKILEYRMK